MLTRYETKDGRRFSLALHSLEEWAEVQVERLTKLGLPQKYITKYVEALKSARTDAW